MSNITAVIFDFNGTLYFDSHLHIEAWKRFLKLHNFPAMTDEQFKEKFLGRNNAEIMEMLHGRHLPPDELETLAEEKPMPGSAGQVGGYPASLFPSPTWAGNVPITTFSFVSPIPFRRRTLMQKYRISSMA